MIVRYQLDAKKPRKLSAAETRRLEAMPIDYSDIPPLDAEFFAKATMVWPPVKQQITVRLDGDVLDWLRSNGKGYQTRMNRILRAAMESQPPHRSDATKKTNKSVRAQGKRKLA